MIVETVLASLAAFGFSLGDAACPTVEKTKVELESYLASELETGPADPDDAKTFRVNGSVDPTKARRIDSFRSAQVWKLAREVRVYCNYGVAGDPAIAVTLSRSLFNPQLRSGVVQRVSQSKHWKGSVGMFGDPVWECQAEEEKLEFTPVCGR